MVRNIVLSDINNEITRIYNSIGSFIVILVVIKNIKASIGAAPIISESLSIQISPSLPSYFRICIHSIHLLPILLCKWHDDLAHS